jgi:molecular chaperone DnaK
LPPLPAGGRPASVPPGGRVVDVAAVPGSEPPQAPLIHEAMASLRAGQAAAPRAAPVLVDVTPMTLGIQTVGGFVEAIIPRNSPVPVERSRLFATTADNQSTVVIRVCQGESRKVAENVILAELQLEDLPPAPRGSVVVKVTFEIDPDGIFSVSALDTKTNRAQRVRITLFGG